MEGQRKKYYHWYWNAKWDNQIVYNTEFVECDKSPLSICTIIVDEGDGAALDGEDAKSIWFETEPFTDYRMRNNQTEAANNSNASVSQTSSTNANAQTTAHTLRVDIVDSSIGADTSLSLATAAHPCTPSLFALQVPIVNDDSMALQLPILVDDDSYIPPSTPTSQPSMLSDSTNILPATPRIVGHDTTPHDLTEPMIQLERIENRVYPALQGRQNTCDYPGTGGTVVPELEVVNACMSDELFVVGEDEGSDTDEATDEEGDEEMEWEDVPVN